MNNVDWEKLCRSQLKAVQILTNEIDKVNTKNKELIHELEISNNSIKTLLNEQEVLHDKIAQLKDLNAKNSVSELPKQEIVIQPDLFNFVDNDKKKSYTVDPNHFNMCLSNRKLTKEQAQFAYDMISKGKLTISNLCKQFKCNSGTISSIMSCKSYKEIVRN